MYLYYKYETCHSYLVYTCGTLRRESTIMYKYKYKYMTAHKGTGPQTSGRAASLKVHPVTITSQILAYNKGRGVRTPGLASQPITSGPPSTSP